MSSGAHGLIPTKTCSVCGKTKAVTEFPADRYSRDGLFHSCRHPCNTRYNQVRGLAWKMAGGAGAYARLPKERRLSLRQEAWQSIRNGAQASNQVHGSPRIVSADDHRLLAIKAIQRSAYRWADRRNNRIHGGWVYLIVNDAWPGWISVGCTTDVDARLSSYNRASPDRDYRVIGHRYFTNRRLAERAIHRRLDQFATRQGEWFRVTPDVAQHILDTTHTWEKTND